MRVSVGESEGECEGECDHVRVCERKRESACVSESECVCECVCGASDATRQGLPTRTHGTKPPFFLRALAETSRCSRTDGLSHIDDT